MIFFLQALLMSILPFYRVDFPVDRFPKEFEYVEYDNGHEIDKTVVKEGDQTYAALKTFIFEEKAGWRYDLNTYANVRVFSAKDVKINCLKDAVVINYEKEKPDKWVQISKDVKGACPTPGENP